jgi:hypothetical protein
LRAGFPHSDICGSKLVCQLPAAFRRLPRPSSPVIAKASTSCTLSLDPITASTLAIPRDRTHQLQASHALGCMHRSLLFDRCIDTINQTQSIRLLGCLGPTCNAACMAALATPAESESLYFFQFVKEQPTSVLRSHKSENGL